MRLKELEEQIFRSNAEIDRLQRINDMVTRERAKVEQRLEAVLEELRIVNCQRMQDEQQMERMMEDKLEIIDQLQ
jgi:hypothetical protein